MSGISETHKSYDKRRFSWRQTRDCVEGPDAVKRAQEVYLPMPSAMLDIPGENASASTVPSSNSVLAADSVVDYQRQYLPWWHSNPAYRAYLQRARFPDLVANTLKGLIGIATKTLPQCKLPTKLEYLKETITPETFNLNHLYGTVISEILTVGKICLVVDVNDAGEFFVAIYTAESNINWEYKTIKGVRKLVRCVFYTGRNEEDKDTHLEYRLKQKEDGTGGIVESINYVDGEEDEVLVPSYKGKTLESIPVFMIGSIDNTANPDIIPLYGLTDIALTIYRENADLYQAHFLTCNPTLFIMGINTEETPRVVGASVTIGLRNPDAKAMYPSTDTTALDHIRLCISDLFKEAVQYGSSFFGESKQKESGEALRLRQSANGANLVHMINLASIGIEMALGFIVEWSGGSAEEAEFEGNTEFAEVQMSAQDLTALVTSWTNGAIDHDTLLDNMRDANIVSEEETNQEIKTKINSESPMVDDAYDDSDDSDADDDDEDDDAE